MKPFDLLRLFRFGGGGIAAALLLSACDVPVHNRSVEEPIMSEPILLETTSLSPKAKHQGRAGVLTAGDIDDALNLEAFQRYQNAATKALELPGVDLSKPVLAQIVGADGAPAPGLRVKLRKPGAVSAFYEGYSGVNGLVTAFPAVLGASALSKVEMRVFPADGAPVTQLLQAGTRQRVVVPTALGWQPDFLDLTFMVDTTGSMADEMAWLTAELKVIAEQVRTIAPNVDIRYGLVTYKARDDAYRVRNFGFTKRASVFQNWIGGERPDGGAGSAEYVTRALESAVSMRWRRGKGERLIFQIGDEPPERDMFARYLSAASSGAGKGIQIFNLAASDTDPDLELLMRQGSVVSGGRYLFLTDDSGVGHAHREPTIPCYQVTQLTGLVTRILASELRGIRVEARPQDIMREVGTYQRGRCID